MNGLFSSRYPELGHTMRTNVAIIDHCFGAMLLFAVFLSIYGSGTNDAFCSRQ